MELQFDKTICRCLKHAVREIQSREETQEVKLPETYPDIGRVIGTWGQVILRSKEWHTDEMTASGGMMTWILYAPEDGTQPQCIETWIPFQMKWDFPKTDREGYVCLQPLLRSVDARTVSARKMMVRGNVAVYGEALEPVETALYQPPTGENNVEMLWRTYPVRLNTQAGEKSFLLDEELTLPASDPAVDKILRYEVLPVLLEQKVMAGRVVFRGTAYVHVLYRSENGNLVTSDFEVPFSQYADLEAETGADAYARMVMAVTSMELDVTEAGLLRLKCGLVGQYVISELQMMQIAQDAYSPDRVVSPRMQMLEIPAVLEERMEPITVEESGPVEQSSLLDISYLPDFPRQSRAGDFIHTELPGMFQILYQNEDGTVQSAVLRHNRTWQIPADAQGQLQMAFLQTGRPQGSISGGSMTARAAGTMQELTFADQSIPMMTGMEVGESIAPDPDRPSLILQRADGRELWEIAKSCGSTMEAIRSANAMTGEPVEGQMLLIPVS